MKIPFLDRMGFGIYTMRSRYVHYSMVDRARGVTPMVWKLMAPCLKHHVHLQQAH